MTDSNTIQRSIAIRAPRARVWRAITDAGEFGAWFRVMAEGEFIPGAMVRMTSTHPGYEGISFVIEIAEVQPESLFWWRWHPGAQQPPDDEPKTLVEFRLSDEDGGTRVTVIESGFERLPPARRAAAFEDNTKGWEFQLQALDGYLGRDGAAG